MEKKWIQIGCVITDGEQVLNVGDIVQYHATGTKYIGNWRLLGVSNKGEMLIVSEEDVSTLTLSGREDYEQGAEKLNNVCIAYGKGLGATGARSIDANDVQKIVNYDIGKKLIFGNDSKSEYWLANFQKSVNAKCVNYTVACIRKGKAAIFILAYSDKYSDFDILGVRAVVSLKKDIKFSREWTLKIK